MTAEPHSVGGCMFAEVEELEDMQIADNCWTKWSCREKQSEEGRRDSADSGEVHRCGHSQSLHRRSFADAGSDAAGD